MGSKSSTPQSPDSDDSSPGSQSYSRAERVLDYGEHSLQQQQARHERSFMERAESSLQGLMMYTGGNSPVVDIRRSDIAGEHQSSLGSSRPGSLPPSGPNRSHSVGGQASPGESAGSSIGSNTGLSHFLSNFNLWRSAAGPSSSSSDRQRAQSLSHMALDPTAQGAGDSSSRPSSSRQQYHHQQQQHSSDLSEDLSSLSLSNPRAALNRLLSSRNGSSGGGASASPSGAVANLPTDRRDSNGTNSSAAFSVRDLTFAAAQEFLAEATMNGLGLNRVYVTHSLPSHMWAVNGIKCPVCSKFVLPDDIECHLVMCLTKPRLNYNEDILTDDNKGECVICLEDLLKGHVIARLPCLCVYHKSCIDQWFDVNRSCPEHPSD